MSPFACSRFSDLATLQYQKSCEKLNPLYRDERAALTHSRMSPDSDRPSGNIPVLREFFIMG